MLFLAEHPKTLEVLKSTQKSPVVLSHFIWTAGEPLQRSLKGILGKLLYEFLIHDDALCAKVLANFRYAKGKFQLREWSDKHLEKLAFEAFSASDKAVCIFLDGVDEAEDQDAIIALVKRLNALPQVRICLSSRPEPLLLNSLRQYPKLYMQDLSGPDIFKYTFEKLAHLPWKNQVELIWFVKEICDKANGVFLWTRLIVELFQKGSCYGDSLNERLKNLEELPDDLQHLYQQMWERENSSQSGYKTDAAQYFNIMLLYVETADCFQGNMHVAHMVMALMPALATAVINKCSELILAEVAEICNVTTARLKSRTAGLLEVTKPGHVTFIHRSAYEFLRNTDLGQDILRLDTTNKEGRDVSLIKGYLTFLHLLWLHHSRPGPIFDEIPVGGHTLLETLRRLRQAPIEKRMSISNMSEILATAKTIYQCGHWRYCFSKGPDDWFRPDFLAAATAAGFTDYANAEIRRLKLDTPAGMKLSARYKNYLGSAICASSMAVPKLSDHVAILIQALDDEPSLLRRPYSLISFGIAELWKLQPLESRRNLLQDLLSQWIDVYAKDDHAVCRVALQLYQAGFNVLDRMLVQLLPVEGQATITDELVLRCTMYNDGSTSVFMETTIDSLLKIVVAHTKVSELATAVNSSSAAFVFRVAAIRNWPGTEDILIPAEMEDIGSAFRPGLDISDIKRGSGRYRGTIDAHLMIPGWSVYLNKVSETAKHITWAEFDEMVIRDGYVFRTQEELQSWPPEPYSPII